MLKIILLSNNSSYVNELRRSAMLADVDIVAMYPSVVDVQRNLIQTNPDIVLASDNLYPGETIMDLINVVQNSGTRTQLYFILKDSQYANYLAEKRIPYVFENDITPTELLNRLTSQYSNMNYAGGMSNNMGFGASQNGYDNGMNGFQSNSGMQRSKESFDTQNIANILNNEAKNRARINEMEEQMRQNPTPGFGFSVVNNFKNICVAIHSPKGGVGKTTIAIELAMTLAARAKELDLNPASQLQSSKNVNVCLVDLNPSFDTMASTLECVRKITNYPTLTDWVARIEEKIFNYLPENEKRKFVQEANVDFTEYLDERYVKFSKEEVLSLLVKDPDTDLYILPSVSLPFDVEYVKPQYISLILKVLKAAFDIVIIDTGNNLSYFTSTSLEAADEIFIISTASKASSVVIGKLLKNLDRLGLDTSNLNLVINNAYGKYADLDASTIASVLGLTLISELPYDENVKKAHEAGHAFSVYNKKTPFAREIAKLAQQIAPLWTVTNKRSAGGAAKKAKTAGGFSLFKKR